MWNEISALYDGIVTCVSIEIGRNASTLISQKVTKFGFDEMCLDGRLLKDLVLRVSVCVSTVQPRCTNTQNSVSLRSTSEEKVKHVQSAKTRKLRSLRPTQHRKRQVVCAAKKPWNPVSLRSPARKTSDVTGYEHANTRKLVSLRSTSNKVASMYKLRKRQTHRTGQP